jgi:uncharacterized protein YukE
MTTPSSGQVTVATQALRTEADLWDEQGHELQALLSKVNDLTFGRLEAGVFQAIVGPYNDVVHQVADRTREGVHTMGDISTTLRQVADVYDAEDAAGEHRLRGLY